MRSAAISGDGLMFRETRWRRGDGSTLEVEIAIAPIAELPDRRVVTVRDITNRRRTVERGEREQRRIAGILDLTQRAHSLTESEIFDETLMLLQQLTGSEIASMFLAVPEGAQFELASRRAAGGGGDTVTVPTRWRGGLPDGSALQECATSLRSVRREGRQGMGTLRQAGLPATLIAAARGADRRRQSHRRRRAARRQERTLRRGRSAPRTQRERRPLEGAPPPAFRRRGRERDGSHGARDAGRDRVARHALRGAGRVQDRAGAPGRGARRKHRRGDGTAGPRGPRA